MSKTNKDKPDVIRNKDIKVRSSGARAAWDKSGAGAHINKQQKDLSCRNYSPIVCQCTECGTWIEDDDGSELCVDCENLFWDNFQASYDDYPELPE